MPYRVPARVQQADANRLMPSVASLRSPLGLCVMHICALVEVWQSHSKHAPAAQGCAPSCVVLSLETCKEVCRYGRFTNDLGVVWGFCEGLGALSVALPALWVLGHQQRPDVANREDEVGLQHQLTYNSSAAGSALCHSATSSGPGMAGQSMQHACCASSPLHHMGTGRRHS